MSIFKQLKVTGANHNPSQGSGRFVVYSSQFNGLLDAIENNPVLNGTLIKGYGNTDLSNPEEGDYRQVTNSSNQLVIQYYTGGAWDTDNETILATPS